MATYEYAIFPEANFDFSVPHSYLALAVFHAVLEVPLKDAEVFLVDGAAEPVGFVVLPLALVDATVLDAVSADAMLLLSFNIVLSRIFTIFSQVQSQIKLNLSLFLQMIYVDGTQLMPHLNDDGAVALWFFLQGLLDGCLWVGHSPEFEFVI